MPYDFVLVDWACEKVRCDGDFSAAQLCCLVREKLGEPRGELRADRVVGVPGGSQRAGVSVASVRATRERPSARCTC